MRGILVAAALVIAGCRVNDVDLTGKACPCPSGYVCDPATNTCAHNLPDDAAIDAPNGPADSAMPSAFKYRRRLTIKNLSTSVMPAGMTIRVSLSGSLGALVSMGKVKADYSDLRVIGDGILGERDRIIDPVGGPAPVALSFSLVAPIDAMASNTAYALYYSATTVGTAPADGTHVFAIYDDFATGISPVWLKNDAPTTSNGQLVLRANHIDGLTTTVDKLPTMSAVEVIATVVDPSSSPTTQPEGTLYYWFGYQHTGDFSASEPWVVWIARGKFGIGAEQKSPVGCENGCEPTPGSQDTAAHYFEIDRFPFETRFYEDTNAAVTIDVMNTEAYSPIVRNFLATSDVLIDYVRARVHVAPEPNITLGAEEAL